MQKNIKKKIKMVPYSIKILLGQPFWIALYVYMHMPTSDFKWAFF